MRFPLFPVFLAAILLFAFSCSRVPITNRRQMNMIPEKELVSLSLNEYQGFLKKNPPLPSSDPRVAMVKRAGTRIQSSVVSYLNTHKMGKRIKDYRWEFNLVDDKTVNAWCMPGGKVVVYSGLLDVTQNEDALAIVMGHEIAHAVARHGNERMSQMLVSQLGGIALSVALRNQNAQTRGIFEQAYGLGSTVGVILPFSRLHETEADKLGLIFAAMSGYDPKEAPKFWQRMAAKSNGKPPAFLSTHPSDQKRIQDLNAFMPEAMKYYQPRK